MSVWLKRIGLFAIVLGIVGAFYIALRDKPIPIDLATVVQGPMTVTIEEEGETRIRDIYTVSAPIAGHLERTSLEEGDRVVANKTVIASIHPLNPPFIDERTRADLAAAVAAAKSAVAVAKVDLTRAQTNFEQADSQYQRTLTLSESKVAPQSKLEQDYSAMATARAQVESAQALIELREAEVASAQARLAQPQDVNITPKNGDCCIQITSPENGVVLNIFTKSEQVVSSGAKIAEVGDPQNLEIVVDLLSSDAYKIRPGTRVVVFEWGGEESLTATVRRVDPAAFTKVSSLGIEEQRVNAVLDFESVPAELGHAYRVVTQLEIWSKDNVVQVPIGAIFRTSGVWSVFVVRDNWTELREISLGRLNNTHAQVINGLEVGEQVILYPSDLLENGSLVQER